MLRRTRAAARRGGRRGGAARVMGEGRAASNRRSTLGTSGPAVALPSEVQ